MSASSVVNVLRVMDDADVTLNSYGEPTRELREARAAVAELVKTAQVAAAVMRARGLNDEPLRAALARFEVQA